MFDFSSLTAIVTNDTDNTYSFVGIYDSELRLPKGCDTWASSINHSATMVEKYSAIRGAFSSLFKTLRVYRSTRRSKLVSDRDSAQPGAQRGQDVVGDHDTEEVIYYRHLDMLDCVLDVYDELGILSLAQRLGRSEKLDYSRLHQHLDRAVYLEDGGFIVDEMTMPRWQINVEPVEIVQLYCFVLMEVKRLLNEEHTLASDIRVLSEQFYERNLKPGDSLFEYDTWQYTSNVLRERLALIDQHTAFKDEGYFELSEALNQFLNSSIEQFEHGCQWGISTFAPVWESMCLSYVIEQHHSKIIACDTTSMPDELDPRIQFLTQFQSAIYESKLLARLHFTQELANVFILNEKKLFPDCVLAERRLKQLQELIYRLYGVPDLCDKLSLDPSVGAAFYPHWVGIKSQNGPTQRIHAPALYNLIQKNVPDNLTAFFLGRAIAGAYESPDSAGDTRERFFQRLVEESIGNSYHVHLLRGLIWETYFNKIDELRKVGYEHELASITRRKYLFGFRHAISWINNNKNQHPELESILEFANNCEAAFQEETFGKPRNCLIIDFKYLTEQYFSDQTIEVRERSARKQFAYEYVLDQARENLFSIQSEFWIPGYDESASATELYINNSAVLGKIIPLRGINVARLMPKYWISITV